MSNTKFTANTDEMRRVAKNIEEKVEIYKNRANELLSTANDLKEGLDAPETDAFIANISELKNDLDRMALKLNEFAMIVKTQSDNIDRTTEDHLSKLTSKR